MQKYWTGMGAEINVLRRMLTCFRFEVPFFGRIASRILDDE